MLGKICRSLCCLDPDGASEPELSERDTGVNVHSPPSSAVGTLAGRRFFLDARCRAQRVTELAPESGMG